MDHNLFRANLNVLHQVYPDLARALESFDYGSSPRFSIEPHSERGWTCVDNEQPPEQQYIHGPGNPWTDAENALLEVNLNEPETFIIYRCGLGYMPSLVYPQMRSGRHAQRMLITEDRWEVLASSFWLVDWTDILRSDRVILMYSEDAAQSIMQFFVTNPIGMLPTLTLLPGCNFTSKDEEIFTLLQQKMQEMGREIRTQTEGFLNDIRNHYQKRREELDQESASPPHVLFVEPEHDYLAKNMIEGLKDLGCRSEMFTGNLRMLHFVHPWLWLIYVREYYPDILLWMNRNSLSPLGKRFLDDLPITKVIWYLDNPARVKVSQEELEATDVVFSFDPSYLPSLRDMGARSVHTLHNAAGLLPVVRLDDNQPPRQGPEVGFVGALAANRFKAVREFWLQRDSEYVKILDGILDDYLADPSLSLADRYQNNSDATKRLPYSGFPVLYLEERATYLRRYHFLEAIKDMGLKTYGAPEWAAPEMAKDLVPCYSDQTPDYHRDLPKLYFDTEINVNIFHVQCIDSPNPRVFDVLTCGGFLLTEYRPCLEEYFEDGVELRWFKTREELAELVAFYREHPEEREEIARRGQEKALACHLARNRMETVMKILTTERKK
ncbi:MAG: glycosyltransferase [bacterium]